jgi:hypothetical protein
MPVLQSLSCGVVRAKPEFEQNQRKEALVEGMPLGFNKFKLNIGSVDIL